MALPGTGLVAETLRDTFSQFKASFGSRGSGAANAAQPLKSSSTCAGCGASLAGISGTIVACEYCNVEAKLP